MKRDVLDEAVASMISAGIDIGVNSIEVGMSDVPSESPMKPYVILNQSPSPAPEGSLANPEDMPYFDYAIKSVGRNHKETTRTSSRVRSIMVDRLGGQWAANLVAEGFDIVDRRTISLGIVRKSAGPDLFEVDDIYRICATTSTS